jgi:hypothetical protein
VTLLTRHVDGVRTTAEGETILHAAKQMEVASFGLIRARRVIPAPRAKSNLASPRTRDLLACSPPSRIPARPSDAARGPRCAMRSADVLGLKPTPRSN